MNKARLFLIIFITLIFLPKISFCDDKLKSDEVENYLFNYTNEVSSNSIEINTYSKNIICIDRKTSTVLYEKNAYQKTPMASTTKIMTCIIAIENSSMSEIVKISKNSASVKGSCLGLKENSEISMNDLLYGLMLRSGNDCAIAIAEHISGTVENYINLMNNKAIELCLTNTNFVTPHGLDDKNHYTSAYDLSILTNYALKNDTFKKIVSTKNYTITLNGISKNISNTNELLKTIDGVYGVKTGFTFNAGRCLVTSYKKNDWDLIIVVLGSNTKKIRGLDTLNIINYITKHFKYIDISSIIYEAFNNYNLNYLNNIYLEKTEDFPKLKLKKFEHLLPLKTNGNLKLETKIYMPNKLSPNTPTNKPIGTLYVYNNTTLISNIDIYLEKKLNPNSWKHYFIKFFELF